MTGSKGDFHCSRLPCLPLFMAWRDRYDRASSRPCREAVRARLCHRLSGSIDLVRARRIQGILPALIQSFEARRLVLDVGEDYHQVLGDNPALLTGLLPQEAPRVLAMAFELGSDNYIG